MISRLVLSLYNLLAKKLFRVRLILVMYLFPVDECYNIEKGYDVFKKYHSLHLKINRTKQKKPKKKKIYNNHFCSFCSFVSKKINHLLDEKSSLDIKPLSLVSLSLPSIFPDIGCVSESCVISGDEG